MHTKWWIKVISPQRHIKNSTLFQTIFVECYLTLFRAIIWESKPQPILKPRVLLDRGGMVLKNFVLPTPLSTPDPFFDEPIFFLQMITPCILYMPKVSNYLQQGLTMGYIDFWVLKPQFFTLSKQKINDFSSE